MKIHGTIDIYVNTQFSGNIHGTLKYIFAIFREDSRNIDVGLHVRYFFVKISEKVLYSLFSDCTCGDTIDGL